MTWLQQELVTITAANCLGRHTLFEMIRDTHRTSNFSQASDPLILGQILLVSSAVRFSFFGSARAEKATTLVEREALNNQPKQTARSRRALLVMLNFP